MSIYSESESEPLKLPMYSDLESESETETEYIKSTKQMNPIELQSEINKIKSELRIKCKARDSLNCEISEIQKKLTYLIGNNSSINHQIELVTDSEGECISMPSSYESDHDRPYELREYDNYNDKSITSYDSDFSAIAIAGKEQCRLERIQNELNERRRVENERLERENALKRYEAECKAEAAEAIEIERKRLIELKRYEAECKAEARDRGESSSDEDDYDSVTTPIDNPNVPTTLSDIQKDALRANKHFKLASLFNADALNQQFKRINMLVRIVFAFKNDNSFNDVERLFLLSELISNTSGASDSRITEYLPHMVYRKVYMKGVFKEQLASTWPKIQKIAKELFPSEYSDWLNESKLANRKLKADTSENLIKMQDPVYMFISQLTASNYGNISSSKLYEQFASTTDKPITIRAFGIRLNAHGLKSKLIKNIRVIRMYVLTEAAINSWLESYLSN